MVSRLDGSALGNLSSEAAWDYEESVMRWFLVLTKPSREGVARINLERQGYTVYYPRLSRRRMHRGRWIERIVSLFPRYLFVRLDMARQSLAPVTSTLGVTSIVRFGGAPASIPDAVVSQLMNRADPESGLHRLECDRSLRPGSAVEVVSGAFEGLRGIFEYECGHERVVVLLGLLGRRTPVRIPARIVVPAFGNDR